MQLPASVELAVTDGAAVSRGFAFHAINALHAERTLFHDALAAHGDVRIELRVERLRPVRLPEVEEPHVVRAVVAAVARSDAAIVDLHIQALAVVLDRIHRAHRLAGSVLTVLAQHRQKARLHVGEFAFPIALDADPLFGAVLDETLLFIDGNIVLRLAGHHACLAAGAAVDVDDHAPLVDVTHGRSQPAPDRAAGARVPRPPASAMPYGDRSE